jgi:hypothetical protein
MPGNKVLLVNYLNFSRCLYLSVFDTRMSCLELFRLQSEFTNYEDFFQEN